MPGKKPGHGWQHPMSINQTATMKMFLSRIVTACALLLAFAATATATTFIVTNTNDSGAGSLRAAIAAAAPNDTVVFAAGLDGGTITLVGNEIAFTQSLTIDATALPNGITIAGGAPSGAYGGLAGFNLRPFAVNGGTLTLRRITMKNCGGVGLLSTLAGGAIRITGFGHLDAFDCTFDSNRADRTGGAISCATATGGISLTRCTFSNNFTQNDNGGGGAAGAIVCTGDLNATNCTFFQNGTTTITGGGVSAAAVSVFVTSTTNPPAMYLTHCTFSGNYAGSDGTALRGCVVVNGGNNFLNYCTMTNCIIAGTTDLGGTPVTDVQSAPRTLGLQRRPHQDHGAADRQPRAQYGRKRGWGAHDGSARLRPHPGWQWQRDRRGGFARPRRV